MTADYDPLALPAASFECLPHNLPTQPEAVEDITVAPNAYPVQFEVPRVTEEAEIVLIEFKATARDPRNRGLTPLGWFTEGWRRRQTFEDHTPAGGTRQ